MADEWDDYRTYYMPPAKDTARNRLIGGVRSCLGFFQVIWTVIITVVEAVYCLFQAAGAGLDRLESWLDEQVEYEECPRSYRWRRGIPEPDSPAFRAPRRNRCD